MAATASTMLPVGTECPQFDLPDYGKDGQSGQRRVGREDLQSAPASVVMFICNHCPFVIHVRDKLAELAREFQDQGVKFVAISSNNIETHPSDAPEKMTQVAQEAGFGFPYLYDESQEVAKAFHAACTPDFFVFDRDLKLTYRGQLDDSRPDSGIPVTGEDLRTAINATLKGEGPIEDQKPSMGCNIKWKPGNEPDYAK